MSKAPDWYSAQEVELHRIADAVEGIVRALHAMVALEAMPDEEREAFVRGLQR